MRPPRRVAGDFECSDVLGKAVAASDNYEEMAYVAAFTVSSYLTSAIRTGKPFNPLLGLEVFRGTGLSYILNN